MSGETSTELNGRINTQCAERQQRDRKSRGGQQGALTGWWPAWAWPRTQKRGAQPCEAKARQVQRPRGRRVQGLEGLHHCRGS